MTVEVTSSEVIAPMVSDAEVDASIARVFQSAETIWDEFAWQVENRTWLNKGYASWDEMRRGVYGALVGVTAPRAERPELVARFRSRGPDGKPHLTQRETAETLGVDQKTVSNYDTPRQKHPSRKFPTSDPDDDIIDGELVEDEPERKKPEPQPPREYKHPDTGEDITPGEWMRLRDGAPEPNPADLTDDIAEVTAQGIADDAHRLRRLIENSSPQGKCAARTAIQAAHQLLNECLGMIPDGP